MVLRNREIEGLEPWPLEHVNIRASFHNVLCKNDTKNFFSSPYSRLRKRVPLLMTDPITLVAYSFIVCKPNENKFKLLKGLKV